MNKINLNKKSVADLKKMRLSFNLQQLDFQTSVFLALLSHILMACIAFLWQNYYRGSPSFDQNLEINIIFEQNASLQSPSGGLNLNQISPQANYPDDSHQLPKNTPKFSQPEIETNTYQKNTTRVSKVTSELAIQNLQNQKHQSKKNIEADTIKNQINYKKSPVIFNQKDKKIEEMPIKTAPPINKKLMREKSSTSLKQFTKAPVATSKIQSPLPAPNDPIKKIIKETKKTPIQISKKASKNNDPLDEILKTSKKTEQLMKKEAVEEDLLLKKILDVKNIDKKNQFQGMGGPYGKQEQQAKINKIHSLSTGYKNSVRNLIYNNIRYSGALEKMTTIIRIKVNQDGKIIEQQMLQSSGEPMYDKAVQAAVRRSGQLPTPEGQDSAEITLYFSPK